MKTRRILAVSAVAILTAGLFAYGGVAFLAWLKLSPDLGKMLEGSYPSVAGILFSSPVLKDFLIKDHQELSLFLLVFLPGIPLFFTLLQFLWPRIFPETRSPFASLTALKTRREPEFTALPFVGRTAELAKLDAFAQHPAPFRWWVLGGEPGAGKTRLAWEWARTLKGWDVKVLESKPDIEALKRWHPHRSSLILVDEFATRSDDLIRLADALLTRDKPLRKPVRLLLVDWAMPGWLETKPVSLPPAQREGEPLICADWSRETFHAALPQLWPKHLPPPDDAQEERLFESSSGNPLALSRWLTQPDTPAQPKRRLFQNWAEEVRQGLRTKGLPEDYLPLVALAAWCGGYPWPRIDDTHQGFPGNAPADFDRRALSALPVPPGRGSSIPALTPETLAVEYTLAELRNHGENYRHWLRRLAWEANPQGAARSLWRLHRLEIQGGLDEEERKILVFLDVSPVEADCVETAQAEAVRAWEAMRVGLLAEAEERKRQAEELGYIIHDYGEQDELELMAAKFQELRGLAEVWPGDKGVREALAVSLVDLTIFYGNPGQLEAMSSALGKLRRLAQTHSGEAAIPLALAMGLYNAAHHYSKYNALQDMASALGELRSLAQAHPDKSAIQLRLALGSRNAANDYGKHGDWQAMASSLDGLCTLTQAHPGDAAIRLRLAQGLRNAALHYGQHGDLQAAASMLAGLRSLALAHPSDVAIQLELAMGLYNAALDYGNLGGWQAAASALDELRTLAQTHASETEIQLWLAKGLNNVTSYYGQHGDWQAMASALDGLRSLAQAHHGDSAIQLRLAQGLYNAATVYGNHGDWQTMASALDGLRSLAQAYPGEVEILLVLATGLVNAATFYGQHGDWQATASVLDELRSLAQAHSDESEIQLKLAQGLHNQTIHNREHASSAIAELKTLARRFPTHNGIQELAHQHGVSFAQQEIAKREALERQARALMNTRHP